jgi:hypothetical protein
MDASRHAEANFRSEHQANAGTSGVRGPHDLRGRQATGCRALHRGSRKRRSSAGRSMLARTRRPSPPREEVRVLVEARVASERRRREHLERLQQNPSEGWQELYVGWQYALRCSTSSAAFWESSDFQDVPVCTPENARIRPQSNPTFDFWRVSLIDGYRRGLRKHGRLIEWRANSGPSPEGLDRRLARCALDAAWWRLREAKREDAERGDCDLADPQSPKACGKLCPGAF